MNYAKLFKKSLEFYGGSDKFEDYRYIGGKYEHHWVYFNKLKYEKKFVNLQGASIYEANILRKKNNIEFLPAVLSEERSEDQHKCLCDHDIYYLMYIQRKTGGNILVVGNCCIKKFFPKEKNTNRLCIRCDKFYKGTKYFECKECRETIKKIHTERVNSVKQGIQEYKNKVNQLKYVGNWKVLFTKYKDKDITYKELIEGDKNYCRFLVDNIKDLNEKIKDYILCNFILASFQRRLKDLESENNI